MMLVGSGTLQYSAGLMCMIREVMDEKNNISQRYVWIAVSVYVMSMPRHVYVHCLECAWFSLFRSLLE